MLPQPQPPPQGHTCPKCGHAQPEGFDECGRCGVIFARLQQARPTDPFTADPEMVALLDNRSRFFMEQHVKHWWEILFGIEQSNAYNLSCDGRTVAFVSEVSTSYLRVLSRLLLGSKRPLDVIVTNTRKDVLLTFSRGFHLLFSQLAVETGAGRQIGKVVRRFGILKRRFDLIDGRGRVFATIESPIWRLWTFPILDHMGRERGAISKKWTGLAQEYFTDADNFQIEMGEGWGVDQKAVILAAAVAIDFDYFENQQLSR